MMISDIKSRPVYRDLAPEPTASGHLLVVEGETLTPALLAAFASAFGPVAPRLHTWLVGGPQDVGAHPGRLWRLGSLADVEDSLSCASRGFGIGDRLYVSGTEPFLWRVAEAAGHVGFASGQIQLHHAGSLRRRVWCTHCHSITDDVTTHIADCAGCGRHLLVRDHFSRRLGAFMGVMVDAEAPGQVPAREEVFA